MVNRRFKPQQSGATLVEFVIATPIVLFLGLGSVQAGLIYHGKSTLNYATFEAARAGAVAHAQIDSMKKELGFRLAPLYGGDGSASRAGDAITLSIAQTNMPGNTHIEILNPSTQAFDDWGQLSGDVGVRVIPNSHLRHRHMERGQIGVQSGMNLHDANLLKIKVTHGFQMKIPIVGQVFAEALQLFDYENAHYYQKNQLPISSVATVRMQNEAWESDKIVSSTATTLAIGSDNENQFIDPALTPVVTCADEYGLSGHDALMSSISAVSAGSSQMCEVATSFSNDQQNTQDFSNTVPEESPNQDECA